MLQSSVQPSIKKGEWPGTSATTSGSPWKAWKGKSWCFQPMTILDISVGGAQIETAFALQLESLHDFRLTLGNRSIVVKGRIAHCHIGQLTDVTALYRTGVEFVDLTEHARNAIGHFVAATKYSQGPLPPPRHRPQQRSRLTGFRSPPRRPPFPLSPFHAPPVDSSCIHQPGPRARANPARASFGTIMVLMLHQQQEGRPACMARAGLFEALLQDLRYGVRLLRLNPASPRRPSCRSPWGSRRTRRSSRWSTRCCCGCSRSRTRASWCNSAWKADASARRTGTAFTRSRTRCTAPSATATRCSRGSPANPERLSAVATTAARWSTPAGSPATSSRCWA